MSIEAMKQMVEALECYDLDYEERLLIIRAGYKAIEEAEKQEPIAWTDENFMEIYISQDVAEDMCDAPPIPLYTHPPKREWVGLTDEEIKSATDHIEPQHGLYWVIAKAIEAKLKEKNS